MAILLHFQGVLDSSSILDPPEAIERRLKKVSDWAKEKANALGEQTFSDNLGKAIPMLIQKNKYIQALRIDRKKLEDGLSTAVRIRTATGANSRLDFARMKDIIFEPFTITFILSTSYFDELVNSPSSKFKIGGFHLSNTVFNIVRDMADKKQLQALVDHEKLHGLVEGGIVGVEYDRPSERIEREFEQYEQRLEQQSTTHDKVHAALRTNVKKFMILENSAQLLINELKEEILAQLESIELQPLKKKGILSGQEGDSFDYHVRKGIRGTVGAEMWKIVKLLQEKQETTQDNDIKQFCGRLIRDIKKNFNSMVEHVRDALAVSERISKDASLRVHGLCMILKPTQYRHIMKYLEYTYGKETVQQELTLVHAFEEPLHATSMVDLANLWPQLTLEERQSVFRTLKGFNPHNVTSIEEDLGIDSLSTCRNYCANLQRLASHIAPSPIDHVRISTEIFQQFCRETIASDFEAGFTSLFSFYAQLTAQERKSFTAVLNEYVTYTLPEEIDHAYPTYSKEQKEQLPVWDVLKRLHV